MDYISINSTNYYYSLFTLIESYSPGPEL